MSGYRPFGRLPAGQQSFIDSLRQLWVETHGRVQYRLPAHWSDDFVDEYGDITPAPIPHPLAGPPPPGIIMDLVANAGTMGCTKFRYSIEHQMHNIYVHKIFGRGSGINSSYLRPCNVLPLPDDSTLSKVSLYVHLYGKVFTQPIPQDG